MDAQPWSGAAGGPLQMDGERDGFSDDGGSVDLGFIRHKVSKDDTVAGIAIKYGVSILDLKQANGLLSETAIFGLDSLVIPLQRERDSDSNRSSISRFVGALGRRDLDPHFASRPGSKALGPVTDGVKSFPDSFLTSSSPTGSMGSRCCSDYVYDRDVDDLELKGSEEFPERVAFAAPKKGSRVNDHVRHRGSFRMFERPVSCSPRLMMSRSEFPAGEASSSSLPPSNPRPNVPLPSRRTATNNIKDYLASVANSFFGSYGSSINSAGETLFQQLQNVVNQPALAGQSLKLGLLAEAVVSSPTNLPHQQVKNGRLQDSASSLGNVIAKERSKIE